MSTSAPWNLRCPWCEWYIVVNPRGMHKCDQGAGVEAANIMQAHVEREHSKTWGQFLAAKVPA